jgi:hypothetical protein
VVLTEAAAELAVSEEMAARMVALKVPDIWSRLTRQIVSYNQIRAKVAYVNFAEKAEYGYCEFSASLRFKEVNRTK